MFDRAAWKAYTRTDDRTDPARYSGAYVVTPIKRLEAGAMQKHKKRIARVAPGHGQIQNLTVAGVAAISQAQTVRREACNCARHLLF